jgi:hypothetical protein
MEETKVKSSRSKRAGAEISGKRVKSEKSESAMPVVTDPEQRLGMIREAAYYIALNRGFNGGDPADDWIQAESQIDNLLARKSLN